MSLKKLMVLCAACALSVSCVGAEEYSEALRELQTAPETEEVYAASEGDESTQYLYTINPKCSNTIEFEDFFDDYFEYFKDFNEIGENELASGGKYLKVGWGPSSMDVWRLEIKLDVKEEGDYFVALTANSADGANTQVISAWELLINGEQIYTISSAHEKARWSSGNSSFEMADYTGISVHLSEGENTVVFSAPRTTSGGNVVKFFADCLELYQKRDIDGVLLTAPEYAVKGDMISFDITDLSGNEIGARDYDALTLETDTPEYIKIENNAAYAINSGVGRVSIKLTSADKEFSQTAEIKIAMMNGLYVKSAQREGDAVKFTVYAVKSYGGGGNALLGAYLKASGGRLGLFDSFTSVKLDKLEAGEEKEYEARPKSGFKAETPIKMFFYDGSITTYRVAGAVSGI